MQVHLCRLIFYFDQSSFIVIHKVANVGVCVFLKYEHELHADIRNFQNHLINLGLLFVNTVDNLRFAHRKFSSLILFKPLMTYK